MLMDGEPLQPAAGAVLAGQGKVIQHEKVIDSLGVFHGLYRLVVKVDSTAPNAETWIRQLRAEAVVHYVFLDPLKDGYLSILYKIPL